MTVLSPIRRLARSGATNRAWAAFVAAGLDAVSDQERVLTLKGRLLKDRAFAAPDDAERLALLRAAAEAYSAAAALTNDSYPRINAASLVYLRGDRAAAATLAADLLAMIDAGQHGGETPYWLEATRAEALLLIGRTADARLALARAVALAPHARKDRAATLRQFRRLLETSGTDASWLADFALPPVIHFRGPMALLDKAGAEQLTQAVRDIAPGMAFGALAAGSDIVAAEAAIACGAELHVLLPCAPEQFLALSVIPFGAEWAKRFDRLMGLAMQVEWLGEAGGLTNAAVRLAEDMAMGLAVDEAQSADIEPVLLRARWQDGDNSPDLYATTHQVVVDLARPANPPVSLLPGPDQPMLLIHRQGAATPLRVSVSELNPLTELLQAGDCIDAFVPDAAGAELMSPRLAAMRNLADGNAVLASRPAALLVQAHCPGCRPVLAGSATAAIGQFDLFDIAF